MSSINMSRFQDTYLVYPLPRISTSKGSSSGRQSGWRRGIM